jgi:hypothetical protein
VNRRAKSFEILKQKDFTMNVIAMRRTLTEEETLALRALFPGEEVKVFTTYPKSADEHLSDCERLAARFCPPCERASRTCSVKMESSNGS